MNTTKMIAAAFAILFASVAFGEIDVRTEYQEHEPIEAKLVAEIPPGAQVKGSWYLDSGQTLDANTDSTPRVHVWAPPGTYRLEFRGMWIKTREVVIEGQTLQVLEGFDFFNESATFKVVGGDDDEDDDDVNPPTPPSGAWGIIVEESSQRTAKQAALFQQLRDQVSDRKLFIVDKDRPGTSGRLVQEALAIHPQPSYPLLIVLNKSGSIHSVVPLADSFNGVLAQLGVK